MSMKSSNRHFLMLILVAVLITAGCVGTGGTIYSMNDGAVIKDFSFYTNRIYDDESVTLSLTVENVGAKRIPGKTNIYIYGTPVTTDEKSRNEWYVSNSGGFDVYDDKEYLLVSLADEEFLPPDPEMNLPGTSKMFYLDLRPPNVPDGMTNDYNFYARLCFPYNTTTITKVVVTSSNELRYEGPKRSEAITRNSAGPIHLTIEGTLNVRPSRNSIPLVFKVTNVGGGFATTQDYACTVDPEIKERNRVMVLVTVDGVEANCGDGIVRLRNGEGTLYCTYEFKEGAPRTEYNVVATAIYNYYVTAQTKIEVMDSMTDTD